MIFCFQWSLSKGLPEVALEEGVNRKLQKSQNLAKISADNSLDKVGALGSNRALNF